MTRADSPRSVRRDSAEAAALRPSGGRPSGPGPRPDGASKGNGPHRPRAKATRSRLANGRRRPPAAPRETGAAASPTGRAAGRYSPPARPRRTRRDWLVSSSRQSAACAFSRRAHPRRPVHAAAPRPSGRPLADDQFRGGGLRKSCSSRDPLVESTLRNRKRLSFIIHQSHQHHSAFTFIPLLQPQLHHAAIEAGAGDAQQPGGLGLVPLRPRQRPANQLAFDAAEVFVQHDGLFAASRLGGGLRGQMEPLGQVLHVDRRPARG